MGENFTDALMKSSLFKGISREELPAMLHCLQPRQRSYRKGEYMAMAGEPLEGIGLILAGKAAVIKEGPGGERVVMSILYPGDLFGEIAAFAEKPLWPATVQAQAAAVAAFLPRERIAGSCARSCRHHYHLINNMLRIVSEKALMLNQKVKYLAIKSMRGRISAFLLDQYRQEKKNTFTLPLNRNEMADFLSVSRPSLSREISRMKKEGISDYHLATFRLLNLEALARAAWEPY